MIEDKIPARLRLQHFQSMEMTEKEIYYNLNKCYGLTDGQIQALINENRIEEEQCKLLKYVR